MTDRGAQGLPAPAYSLPPSPCSLRTLTAPPRRSPQRVRNPAQGAKRKAPIGPHRPSSELRLPSLPRRTRQGPAHGKGAGAGGR